MRISAHLLMQPFSMRLDWRMRVEYARFRSRERADAARLIAFMLPPVLPDRDAWRWLPIADPELRATSSGGESKRGAWGLCGIASQTPDNCFVVRLQNHSTGQARKFEHLIDSRSQAIQNVGTYPYLPTFCRYAQVLTA